MPSPTLTPPASLAPLLAASIAPGPPPVITAKPASTSARPSRSPAAYAGSSAGVRAEPKTRDRRAELGQRAEALDELGLDAQHPPRVGVHPVARAAGVEQPLVGGAGVDLVAAHAAPGPCACPSCGPSGRRSSLPQPGAQLLLAALDVLRTGTCSSCLCASIGSPGPKLTAGTPRPLKRATSVQPNFGLTSPPTASTNAAAAGTVEPRQRAGRGVGDRDVVPVEELADERLGLGLAAVGGEAVVDLDDALVGHHVAGDAAADEDRVEALVVLQPVDDRRARLVAVEPLAGSRRPRGSR